MPSFTCLVLFASETSKCSPCSSANNKCATKSFHLNIQMSSSWIFFLICQAHVPWCFSTHCIFVDIYQLCVERGKRILNKGMSCLCHQALLNVVFLSSKAIGMQISSDIFKKAQNANSCSSTDLMWHVANKHKLTGHRTRTRSPEFRSDLTLTSRGHTGAEIKSNSPLWQLSFNTDMQSVRQIDGS